MTDFIETPRMRLRSWTPDDMEPWARLNADPKVMEFFTEIWESARSESHGCTDPRKTRD